MECFHDFCLACDKESSGPYCSQACRLADQDKGSAPSSPSTNKHPPLNFAFDHGLSPQAREELQHYSHSLQSGRPKRQSR
ncbi:hypothetical protein K470DRAFT_254458 [Piedraia hortae CBS 480.64]|uniref:Uncharacterized protein n=1 Tax=Piedraia hortae CBS 480.64 TaxID=1314780 RepID=A0A6A7C9D4_9PEZI|nr:hypothetical protein K470DRAFT_254458 [Piedraia hortae CBS 480.64]